MTGCHTISFQIGFLVVLYICMPESDKQFKWAMIYICLPLIITSFNSCSTFELQVEGDHERSIYLYPGMKYGYDKNGHFGQIKESKLSFLMGIPMVEFLPVDEIEEQSVVAEFDPSTPTRISRRPLQEDPYEKIHVYVATSAISPLAGEGLFAKRTLTKGHLICLFNGIRRIKKGRTKAIGALDEEWSDYRLTLGKVVVSMR